MHESGAEQFVATSVTGRDREQEPSMPPFEQFSVLSPEPHENGESTEQPGTGCKKGTDDCVPQAVTCKSRQGKGERGDTRDN